MVTCEATNTVWVEESGIVVTSWSHLGLWRPTAPKWMEGMGKGTQPLLIRGP